MDSKMCSDNNYSILILEMRSNNADKADESAHALAQSEFNSISSFYEWTHTFNWGWNIFSSKMGTKKILPRVRLQRISNLISDSLELQELEDGCDCWHAA